MIRATTPTHTFTFPKDIAPADCDKILITYKQGNKKVLEKTETDLTIGESSVSYTFTQEDTKLFTDREKASVQMRVLLLTGEALASDIMQFSIKPVLNDEVLTNELGT